MKKNVLCLFAIQEYANNNGFDYVVFPQIFLKNNGNLTPKQLRIEASD